jgi:hypothetical protein
MAKPEDFVKVSTAFKEIPCPICGVKYGLVGAGMMVKKGEPIYSVTYCQGCENHFMTNKPFISVKKEDCTIVKPGEIPPGFGEVEPIMDQKIALQFVSMISGGMERNENPMSMMAKMQERFGDTPVFLGEKRVPSDPPATKPKKVPRHEAIFDDDF